MLKYKSEKGHFQFLFYGAFQNGRFKRLLFLLQNTGGDPDYRKETQMLNSSVYHRFFPNLFNCDSSHFITFTIYDASSGLYNS